MGGGCNFQYLKHQPSVMQSEFSPVMMGNYTLNETAGFEYLLGPAKFKILISSGVYTRDPFLLEKGLVHSIASCST